MMVFLTPAEPSLVQTVSLLGLLLEARAALDANPSLEHDEAFVLLAEELIRRAVFVVTPPPPRRRGRPSALERLRAARTRGEI